MTDERLKEIQARFAEIGENEAFYKGLAERQNAEQVMSYLSNNNITITTAEVTELQKIGISSLNELRESAKNELTAEDLDNVAGGSKFWRGVASVVVGAAGGFVGGLVCGAVPALTPVVYKAATAYAVGASLWTAAG